MSPIIPILTFILLGVFHSIAAQDWFKDNLKKITGEYFVDHFWRINYCIISLGLLKVFEVFAHLSFKQNSPLFTYPVWAQAIMATFNFTGIVILYWSFVQSDFFEYWGVKQCAIGIAKLFNPKIKWDPYKNYFGTRRLETKGIYKFARHPMLTGGFLVIVTQNTTPATLLYTLLYTTYVLIGIIFEERRLIRVFGNDYRKYQSDVGAFFPKIKILNRLKKDKNARIYRYS